MKIAKVDEMVKAAFDSMSDQMTTWIDAQLKDTMSVYDISELATKLPYNHIDEKEIIKKIDDLPLTRTDYDAYVEYATTAVREANYKLRGMYDGAQKRLGDKFKDALKRTFLYDGKNKDKVFDVLYRKAYSEGHSNGYLSVRDKFDELDQVLHDALKAMDMNMNQ